MVISLSNVPGLDLHVHVTFCLLLAVVAMSHWLDGQAALGLLPTFIRARPA